METGKIKDEDHYKCRAVKAERDQLQAENARLRAELEARDKAVQVAEGLCPTCVDSLGVELARKCPAKPPAHPPRQAVPDGLLAWLDKMQAEIPRLIADAFQSGVDAEVVSTAWGDNDERLRGDEIASEEIPRLRAMLTAAPEARSEAEIQAEALEAFGRKVWNEAEQWSKGMTKTALYNCAEWANAEAARLREGEK